MLQSFYKEESQFPFTAYCLSIAHLYQSLTKSSRFCVSSLRYEASCIVIADNSCPLLQSIYHVLSLLQYHSNQMFIAIRFTKFMSAQFSIAKIKQTLILTTSSEIFFNPFFSTNQNNLLKRTLKTGINYILIILTKGYDIKIFYNNFQSTNKIDTIFFVKYIKLII